jgi:hypothetical protein
MSGEKQSQSVIFTDTSIEIGRTIHREEIQISIHKRLSDFSKVITGMAVRNEYKRRLLKQAKYLLSQFERRGSYDKVRRHVQDTLRDFGGQRQICLQTLTTIDEHDDDTDRTERARLYLRDLLRLGLEVFDSRHNELVRGSGCAMAAQPIKERVPYLVYDFGPDKCVKFKQTCTINSFLTKHRETLEKIANYLATLPSGKEKGEKSEELQAIEGFIRTFLEDPTKITSENPCSKVGDLLIALESAGTDNFYTMNCRESQYLCHVLGQRMIYRPPNSDNPEQDCAASADWPPF